jgi:hypothetical protein
MRYLVLIVLGGFVATPALAVDRPVGLTELDLAVVRKVFEQEPGRRHPSLNALSATASLLLRSKVVLIIAYPDGSCYSRESRHELIKEAGFTKEDYVELKKFLASAQFDKLYKMLNKAIALSTTPDLSNPARYAALIDLQRQEVGRIPDVTKAELEDFDRYVGKALAQLSPEAAKDVIGASAARDELQKALNRHREQERVIVEEVRKGMPKTPTGASEFAFLVAEIKSSDEPPAVLLKRVDGVAELDFGPTGSRLFITGPGAFDKGEAEKGKGAVGRYVLGLTEPGANVRIYLDTGKGLTAVDKGRLRDALERATKSAKE